jgi:ribosomal protein S18 acetylase RimI-like enzyme
MISAYNGVELEALRSDFLKYIASEYGFTQIPDHETQAGEYYIDCVSVFPRTQGKGIGKKLINALIKQAAGTGWDRVGLLVSKENPDAERLYSGLGFQTVNERKFMGGDYFHMQYAI